MVPRQSRVTGRGGTLTSRLVRATIGAHQADAARPAVRCPHITSLEDLMKPRGRHALGAALLAVALAGATPWIVKTQGGSVAIDPDDIGGTVTGAKGPEAGVWVIAETRDLPTRYVKVVVTDDQGRYVLPDLPKANYDIWVRGYGLVDSPKTKSAPGKQLNLKAVAAPNRAAAAQYYPAIY